VADADPLRGQQSLGAGPLTGAGQCFRLSATTGVSTVDEGADAAWRSAPTCK
jgi:hypothetical protein